MNELMAFNFNGKQCRTAMIYEKPYWVGKDVCDVLGYKDTNNALKLHCKGVAKYHPLQTAGGIQNVRVINEPDLYRLVGGSKLPEAQRFEAWIYEEVIPQIVRTGKYEVASVNVSYPAEATELINKSAEVIRWYRSENQRLQRENTLYRKIEKLGEQNEKIGKPLSAAEREKVEALAKGGCNAADITQILNRRSDCAVRRYLKYLKEAKA